MGLNLEASRVERAPWLYKKGTKPRKKGRERESGLL